MILFISDFHRQMLKATEILASDWLRANFSVKITDKMLCEMLPRCHMKADLSVLVCSVPGSLVLLVGVCWSRPQLRCHNCV